jgi:sigma-E factor negative regulatory protein RseB
MRSQWLVGSFLLGFALTSYATDDDWQLLRKAGAAARQVALSGTYLHQTPGLLETFLVARSGNAELYRAVDGPPREIVLTGSERVVYAPDRSALQRARVNAMRLFPSMLPDDISNIQQSYSIRRLDSDRVADLDCVWLLLRPKDNARYSMRLCIEPETGLPLKSVLFSPRNEEVELNSFTELDLGQLRDRSLLRPHLSGKLSERWHKLPVATVSAEAAAPVSGLPNGFRLVKAAHAAMPGDKGGEQHHYMFSDGLAMLSLFVEPSGGGKQSERVAVLYGPVGLASRDDGDYRLTLVGDLPEQMLANLIQTIRLGKQ